MEELKKVFLDAGVSEDQIDSAISYMELTKVEELRFYKKLKDYEDAGVTSKSAQRKLVSMAEKLDTEYEAEKAAAIETKRAQASVEVAKAAEESAKLAEEQQVAAQAKAVVSVLIDAYKDDKTWIEALQQKGILEFDAETYIAGIKAVLAANIGVFEAIPRLMQMVNDYAIKNAKPSPGLFYVLQSIMTRRQFGLVVVAADTSKYYKGVPIYATESDMVDLMSRMRNDLVPNILNAARAVANWYGLYSTQAMNDFFTNQVKGEKDNVNYPSPALIEEAGKKLRLSVNHTFAGNGIQKALAICDEYGTFVEVLNDTALPQSIGAVDRDAVLAQLGFDAGAAAIRSEKFIINFVINIMQADSCPKKDELKFYKELYGLANQIDWSGLSRNAKDVNLVKECVNASRATLVGTTASAQATISATTPIGIGVNQMDGQEATMSIGTGIGAGREC